tara:strand:+ start:11452 stop:13272 length:1821 start_codon:yes stop_codon:yes gene_type:complete
MSNKWSSYKKDHLLMENWRAHLKNNPQSNEKIEEFFGLGRKKPQVKGTVYNDIIAEVTVAIANLIKELGLDIDSEVIVDEFQTMITNQNFELSEEQEIEGGRAEYGETLKFDISKAPKLTEFFKALKELEASDTLMKLSKTIVRAGFDEASVAATLTDGKGISGSPGAAHRGRSVTGVPTQSSGRNDSSRASEKTAAAAAVAAERMDGSRREGMENAVLEYGGKKTSSQVQIWTSSVVPKDLEKTFHLGPEQVKEIADGLLPELPRKEPAADAPAEELAEPELRAAAESLKRDMQRIIDEVFGGATSTKTPDHRNPRKITPPREKQAAKDPEKWKVNPAQLIAKIVGLLKPPSQETAASAQDIAGYLKAGLESTGWFEFDETAPEEPESEPEPEDIPDELTIQNTDTWSGGTDPVDLTIDYDEEESDPVPEEETFTYLLPDNFKVNQDIRNRYKGEDFEGDWAEFVNALGRIKFEKGTTAAALEEISGSDVGLMIGKGKKETQRLRSAIGAMARNKNKNTGSYRILQALKGIKPPITKSKGGQKVVNRKSKIAKYLQGLWSAIEKKGGEAPAETSQTSQAAQQEGLLRESAINRWQLIAGIKKTRK